MEQDDRETFAWFLHGNEVYCSGAGYTRDAARAPRSTTATAGAAAVAGLLYAANTLSVASWAASADSCTNRKSSSYGVPKIDLPRAGSVVTRSAQSCTILLTRCTSVYKLKRLCLSAS